MTATDFWLDTEHAKKITKHAADLHLELNTWESLLKELDDLSEVITLAQKENDDTITQDVQQKLAELQKHFSGLEFTTLFSGEHDDSPVILAIHAGSGGTEAQDWTAMLLRMYSRFAEQKGWTVQALHESRGEEAGFKSVTLRIDGRYAYGYLKSESGVHRLVRISPFDAEKMRHTTFALVEVLPEFAELKEMEIDLKDLRIDTFMSGGKGGQSVNTTYSAVRLVHIPTGLSATCQNERSQKQNRETAMNILKAKLHQKALLEQGKQKQALRGDYQSAEWGNQIRSYVLHPYKLVKDHRTDYESTDAEAVLNGALGPFMEAYLRSMIKNK